MRAIAIDPGKAGGFALLAADKITAIGMQETEADIVGFLTEARKEALVAYIEDVPRAIFGAGASQLAVLHRNAGLIEGALIALRFSVIRVPPKKWQKAVGVNKTKMPQRQWKLKLKAEAQRRFPDVENITLETADALLILAAAMSGTLNSD